MKKNTNKKGFTLIELLAVIVVLALVMIFAVPSVLDASTSARKKNFKLYAQKVLTEAQNYYQLKSLEGTAITSLVGCTSLKTIGLDGTGNYKGSVNIAQGSDGKISYTIYLADNNYMYVGADASTVNGNTDPEARVEDNVANIEKCGDATKTAK